MAGERPMLKRKKGKGNLLGLALDMRMLEEELGASFEVETDVLSNMDEAKVGWIALKIQKECGVSLVYDDEEEEDALGYYKSWNHIIDGPHYQAQKEWSWFRAFSQRNPGTIGSAHEGKGESSGSSDFR
ncbi:hypothetical protein L2E82_29763 [Cichorium intybus]|uniref:Uncharacterized protein n=1 Tax=Cichorium intybus TaxID=13427 RepID=A0ACB9CYN4_CICIN|nr:hypothetical protein L2E82_29763 [Cichorium intybus]